MPRYRPVLYACPVSHRVSALRCRGRSVWTVLPPLPRGSRDSTDARFPCIPQPSHLPRNWLPRFLYPQLPRLPRLPVLSRIATPSRRMRERSRIRDIFPIPVQAGRGSLLPSPIALRWVSWFNNHLFCAKSSRNMDFFCKGLLLFKASHHRNCPICPGKTEGKNSDAVSCRWFLPSF